MTQHDANGQPAENPDEKTPDVTAVHDHASHPEAGSQMREEKTFGKQAAEDPEAEIAADDAGASAMAEEAQKKAGAPEQPQ